MSTGHPYGLLLLAVLGGGFPWPAAQQRDSVGAGISLRCLGLAAAVLGCGHVRALWRFVQQHFKLGLSPLGSGVTSAVSCWELGWPGGSSLLFLL